jgi:pterin-4a-carbinolamine dehydratase
MRHQEFLAGVATRGGFTDTDDARRAADAVLASVAEHLSRDDREALAAALPNLLEQESGVDTAGGGGTPTDAGLVEDVARRSGWTSERARYALTAVTGELAAQDPDLGARLARVLPSDVQGDGPTLPPDAASEGLQGRPQPVDPDELERRLKDLVDWSGDLSGIERTIALPSERIDLVVARVREAERELGHRTHVADRSDGSLTLRARTESLQAVTEIDLVLAARVDDAVAAVGSGG